MEAMVDRLLQVLNLFLKQAIDVALHTLLRRPSTSWEYQKQNSGQSVLAKVRSRKDKLSDVDDHADYPLYCRSNC